MIEAMFKNLCPNCAGDISSQRLLRGFLCNKCMPQVDQQLMENFYEKELAKQEYDEWEKIFKEFVGFNPFGLQKYWVKKVLFKRSFALLAPTGIGKTTWGLVTALYFARKSKKSYVVLPTKLLILQSYQKLKDKVNKEEILVFGIEKTHKEKQQKKEFLKNGKFKILITSSMFLYKNIEVIPKDFEFIFVDDVDSLLKTAKNIDKVLYLIGFSKEDIDLTLKYIKYRKSKNLSEEEIRKLKESVINISKKSKGIVVLSSATSSPKSERIKLFRELLAFDVGKPIHYLRNIEDVYEKTDNLDVSLVEKIKKLGSGGLVFVSSDYGKEYVNKIKEMLSKHAIIAETYENINETVLEKYKNGEIQVLIGISSYKNPLVRGLDLPETIRYAVFYGVPKITVNLDIENNVNHLLIVATSVRSVLAKNKDLNSKYLVQLDKNLKSLNKLLYKRLLLQDKINMLRESIKKLILSPDILQQITVADNIFICKRDNMLVLCVADVTAYIQASGRTSRLYTGGVSKGLSYILVDNEKVFNNLVMKSRWWFSLDVSFKEVKDIDLNKIIKEIDLSREIIRNKEFTTTDFLKPVLVIVESPHKARTIANFFGKPMIRNIDEQDVYEVITEDKYLVITASLGHVFDLNKEVGFYGVLEGKNFIPVYESIEGKQKIISAIREVAKEFDLVLIATDPDTEGEKIAWDLKNMCSAYSKDVKRMEFHEVTKRAILNSLKEIRDINEDLVKAQIIRRISDRWVGFRLSEMIQRKFSKNYLSAGRVQTPVLGWVIKRQQESKKKIYLVIVRKEDLEIKFEFEDKNEALNFFNELKSVEIKRVSTIVEEKNPLPPFSTDVVLKEASEKYKLPVTKTMEILQDLFERGFITYHRTDSIRVSDVGINIAREYIREQFGEDYFKARSWSTEGAHECIRPTRVIDTEDIKSMIYSGEIIDFTGNHLQVYDLIFKRFIASQMRGIVVKKSKILFKTLDKEITQDIIEEIIQNGFNKIFPLKTTKLKEGVIDVLKNKYFHIIPRVQLFTQGTLIEEMKKKGIGRPSTYATIINRLLERGYVVEKKGYLFPTKLGEIVFGYLNSDEKRFKFVKESFTRNLEELMDKVESGTEDYQQILRSLKKELDKS